VFGEVGGFILTPTSWAVLLVAEDELGVVGVATTDISGRLSFLLLWILRRSGNPEEV